MKVIFIKDVPKIAKRYDVKEFADGYARNALINKGFAIEATAHELAKIDAKKAHDATQQRNEEKAFSDFVAALEGKPIIIHAKANNKGNLFSSVQKKEIIAALEKTAGAPIDESVVTIGMIKEVGEHTIILKKGNISASCVIHVVTI